MTKPQMPAPALFPDGLRRPTAAIPVAGLAVEIVYNGVTLRALPGETLIAALLASGCNAGKRQYCGMGACFACLVTVDGVPGQRACLVKVRAGMQVGVASSAADRTMAPDGERSVAVAVVGAGPAGLAAAIAAAERGLDVVLLDERAEAGGQYFKPLSSSHRFANKRARDRQFAAGARLVHRAEAAGVEWIGDAMVWHAEARAGGGARLMVLCDGHDETIHAERLIVATGARERPWMVPGWELPGVMTVGAAQTLTRAHRVVPGRRVLIAGNGPLNLQLAVELLRAGVTPLAVAEASGPPTASPLAAARMLLHGPALVASGLAQLAELRRAGVDMLYCHVLVRVEGDGEAARAVLAAIDAAGHPRPGSERSFAVDAVCTGYGFLPNNELTRLLGCRHATGLGDALLPVLDTSGRTSLPGIYGAGDATGPWGASMALVRGEMAGHAAADDAGAPYRPRGGRRGLREAAFQKALRAVFAAPGHPLAYADPETIVCRCEGVTLGRIQRHLSASGNDLGALKRATRCGMGRCQGRYCADAMVRLCGGQALESDAWPAPQAPIKPVPIGAIAAALPPTAPEQIAVPPIDPPATPSCTLLAEAAIVIVGGGIIGICAALEMARAGADVLLLERGEPNGQASGANAGSLHVQLLSYAFDDLDTAAARETLATLLLCRESARLWEQLAPTLDDDIELRRTGGLSVADDAASLARLRQKVSLEQASGIDVELLSGEAARSMAPALSPHILAASYSPDEGKLNPQRAGPAVLRAAMAAGLRVLAQTGVVGMTRSAHGFELQTTRGMVRAGQVLNAAGAWSPGVAAMLGVRLPVRRAPLQMLVTETVPGMVDHLIAHASERLTIKQTASGNIIIGGGWRARFDPETGAGRPTLDGLRGNLAVALRVLPGLRDIHLIRSWTAFNVGTVGPPLLAEADGVRGFYNVATANGLTLGPLMGKRCAELVMRKKEGVLF